MSNFEKLSQGGHEDARRRLDTQEIQELLARFGNDVKESDNGEYFVVKERYHVPLWKKIPLKKADGSHTLVPIEERLAHYLSLPEEKEK